MCFVFFSQYIFDKLIFVYVSIFHHLNEPFDNLESVIFWFREGIAYLLKLMLPILLSAFIGALFINIYQVGLLVSLEPILPRWNKVNIFHPGNFKKFFGVRAFMRLFFGIGKLIIIFTVSIIFIKMNAIPYLMQQNIKKLLIILFQQVFYISIIIAVLLFVWGIFDFLYQKWRFAKDMKMTKQEVKDEYKQSEVDLLVKSKIHSLMEEFSKGAMKSNIPQSDVIIANDIHYAVAIKYDSDKMPAPVCVAKGARKIAVIIKNIAKEHKIPIIENPLLASTLYKSVKEGMFISSDFYHSIAKVLACVYKTNMGRKIKN